MSIFIDKIPSIDPRLARHVEHDSRSKGFAFKVATPKPIVTTFWTDAAPILDQKDLGGCVGWTGADILNTDKFTPVRLAKNKGQYYFDADGLAFYEAATHADNIRGFYPPNDTGSSGLGLAKALKKLGLIDGYTHAFTWDAFLQAIMSQPVAFGTLWTKAMFNPDAQGVVHVGPITNSTIAGGHEYSGRGYDVERDLVLCRNHWNKTWNPGTVRQKVPGEFWVPGADMRKLLLPVNQGDITILHGVGVV